MTKTTRALLLEKVARVVLILSWPGPPPHAHSCLGQIQRCRVNLVLAPSKVLKRPCRECSNHAGFVGANESLKT